MSQLLVKVFAILSLTRFNSVYFSVNFSMIFTWLILGLHSVKSGQHSLKTGLCTLRIFKTFLLISSANTWLNLTNCSLFHMNITASVSYKKLASRSSPCFYTYLFSSDTCTLLFCWKIKSCCDHCFSQQIKPLFNYIDFETILV